MSGVSSSVPGRSMTWTSARSVSETTATARAIRSKPDAGAIPGELEGGVEGMTILLAGQDVFGGFASGRGFEHDRRRHGHPAREAGDALAGDPGGVQDPVAHGRQAWAACEL